MDLGKGDSEEHAMLLANFFNYIDRENGNQEGATKDIHSYIVYGEAVPDGFVWFVARRCKKTLFCEIWNPMNAECYNFDRVKTETQ